MNDRTARVVAEVPFVRVLEARASDSHLALDDAAPQEIHERGGVAGVVARGLEDLQ